MKKIIYPTTLIFILTLFLAFSAQAQKKIDEESTKLIREYTTDKRFLNPLIDHIPESPNIPSPRDLLGYIAGAPKKLTYYADIIRYMKTLAQSTEKVELIPIGKTNLGRMMYIVVISSEDTIKNIETYKGYAAVLYDPRKTSEEKAKEIIKKAKPIYYISCNLHSAETGSAEMSMELAYRLAVSEDPYIKNILENVIILIIPSLEPDGHDTLTDWYYQYRKDISDERSRFPGVPYWGKYVLHDNNRDIGVNQPLTKNAIKMFLEWHPQLHLDLHEPFPYLYISPGKGPFRSSVDPILIDEWHWLTFYEVTELTKMGMPGVWTHGFPASWYPGYLFEMSNLHNAIGRFYETLGNAGATTAKRTRKNIDEAYGAFDFFTRHWFRPWPAMDEVLWSHRNNVNYQQSGVLSSLKNVAKNRETILYNFWKKGFNAVNKGKNEPPYAWIVPSEQKHPVEMANLLNLLMTQGVEVHKIQKEVKIKEGTFPKGSYLVRMDQPYRVYAKTMLEVEKFPEKYSPPYDDTGWTLGYMHGVETVKIDDKSILDAKTALLKEKVRIKGKVVGKTAKFAYIIPHNANNNLITFRFALKNQEIYAAEEVFTVKGREFPAGSFIIPGERDNKKRHNQITSAVEKLGLVAYAVDEELKVKKHLLNLPRVALYHTWTYTQDSGWVRFTFDQYKIPYAFISKDRVREGNLKKDYDVIVIPRQSSGKSIVFGIDPKLGPIPYEKTEKFKYLGIQDQSKDITGGMGYSGLKNLKEFVDLGGVLILLGRSSQLAMEYGFVRYISEASSQGLVIPGSILKGDVVNSKSPIVYGYEKNIPLFHGFGFMFNIPEEEEKYIVLSYTAEDDICLSGIVKGKEKIKGKAALVDVPVGKGHVIMSNFNPLHRFQNKVDFMLVFNILLNFDDLDISL